MNDPVAAKDIPPPGDDLAQAPGSPAPADRCLRLLGDAWPQPLWTGTPDGRWDYVNPPWSAGAVTDPATALDAVHPDDRAELEAAWQGATAAGHLCQAQFRLRRPNGDYRWYRALAVPLRDEGGLVVKWFGACTDIDSPRRTEEALRLTTERFQAALRNSPVVVCNQDRDLRYTWVYNPAPGQQPENFIGKTDADIFRRESDIRLLAGIKEEVLASGRSQRREVSLESPCHGREIHYDLTVEPLRDETGDIVGITCAAVDISPSKEAEKALRSSQERQSLLLDLVSTLLTREFDEAKVTATVFDKVKGHLDVDFCLNYRVAGPCLDLVVGLGIPEELLNQARHLQPGQAFCNWVASEGRQFSADARRIAEDAAGAFVRLLGARSYLCHPLLARDGRVLGTLALMSCHREEFSREDRDFLQTICYFLSLAWERAQAEREVQRLNADLEGRVRERTAELGRTNDALLKTNLELKQFAHVAAHDMQTPLRSIAGFAQLLRQDYEGRLDTKADLYIGHVVSNIKRLQLLIEDLLTYSRLDSRARPRQRTDLRQVFDEVAESLAPLIREKGAEVVRERLPTVAVDRIQIAQVLQNLIENSLKYNHSPRPRVEVSAEAVDRYWQVAVRDNGIGIPARHRERIFGLFRRLHTYQDYPGSGIGLAICHRIVAGHGGRIWVESREGEGSTFYFTLPREGAPPDGDPPPGS